MLNIIVDGCCSQKEHLSREFVMPHIWQMHLVNLVNHEQGIAHLLAQDLGLVNGAWMIASPIYWQATHNDALITNYSISLSSQYFAVLQNFLALDMSKLYVHPTGIWIFECSNTPNLVSQNLENVMHQSLYPFLENMPSFWRKWFTESQMLFSQMKNTQVNGVWPWGGGKFAMDKPVYVLDPDLWPKAIAPMYPWDDKLNVQNKDLILLVKSFEFDGLLPRLASRFPSLTIWWDNGVETIRRPSIWSSFLKKFGIKK
jgi:hypothetical protein